MDTVQEALRAQLLDVMSAVSEDEYAAGWYAGIADVLAARGGIWEVLGRACGWPLGPRGEGGWVSWDEAQARLAGKGR